MPESQALAALLASKLCHDLVSPVAALTTALGVFDDDPSTEMRENAIGLIRSSATSLASKLEFYRMALGSAAMTDSDIDYAVLRRLCETYLGQNRKIALVWQLGLDHGPGVIGRMIPNLLLVAIDSLPRGGTVTMLGERTADGIELVARAEAERVSVKEIVRAALSGRPPEGETPARMIQPYLLHLAATSARAELVARESEGRVDFVIRAPILAPAL
jgi:histidine phosphotransferase ChpT